MSERKIVHGTRNFGYAPINVSSEGVASFGTPVIMEGITKFSIEIDESQNSIYADNKVYAVLNGAKVRTATATVYQIVEDYATNCLGFKKQDNGMLTDTGVKPQHCLFFESTETDTDTGKEVPTLHYLYSAVASEPKVERETDGTDVTASELEISYTCKESTIAMDKDGNAVQYGHITRTDENASLYDTFKSKVLLPTDAVA